MAVTGYRIEIDRHRFDELLYRRLAERAPKIGLTAQDVADARAENEELFGPRQYPVYDEIVWIDDSGLILRKDHVLVVTRYLDIGAPMDLPIVDAATTVPLPGGSGRD